MEAWDIDIYRVNLVGEQISITPIESNARPVPETDAAALRDFITQCRRDPSLAPVLDSAEREDLEDRFWQFVEQHDLNYEGCRYAVCDGCGRDFEWISANPTPLTKIIGGRQLCQECLSRAPEPGQLPAERRVGLCDSCGRKPRGLTRIDSGQWVCRNCLRELRPPKARSASRRAREEAHRLGLTFTADISHQALGELVDLHRDVKSYVRDVWRQITAPTAKNSEIPPRELDLFVAGIVNRRDVAAAIQEIELHRYDRASEGSARHPHRVDSKVCSLELAKSAVPTDHHFERIASQLRQRWLPQ